MNGYGVCPSSPRGLPVIEGLLALYALLSKRHLITPEWPASSNPGGGRMRKQRQTEILRPASLELDSWREIPFAPLSPEEARPREPCLRKRLQILDTCRPRPPEAGPPIRNQQVKTPRQIDPERCVTERLAETKRVLSGVIVPPCQKAQSDLSQLSSVHRFVLINVNAVASIAFYCGLQRGQLGFVCMHVYRDMS